MPVKVMTLELNYLKLRYHLETDGYVLSPPSTSEQRVRAAQSAEMVCEDCYNRVQYQCWIRAGAARDLIVCMECYRATEL